MTALPFLIIDDDAAFGQILQRSLNRQNLPAALAASPDTALAMAATHQPEYIVLDLNLDGQNGLHLISPLLETVPHARIVVLTGYASIPTAVSALKLGAIQYLAKPATVQEILHALQDEATVIPEALPEDKMSVQDLEWEYIQRAMAEHDGNISATARALKMHRRTLQRKLLKKRPLSGTSG